jgi:hypothetical protein
MVEYNTVERRKRLFDIETEIRFWDKVNFNTENDCWEWKGAKNITDYGTITINNKALYVHRISYEISKGKIPTGLQIDHLCRNRKCVNPEHLEAVSLRENLNRGIKHNQNSNKTHCVRGHELKGDNLYVKPDGARRCRKCNNEKQNIRRRRSKHE